MKTNELNSVVESLHPLEIKLLFVFEAGKAVDDNILINEAAIEQSQKDMAIGWLLAKGILSVTKETVDRSVVLTETGERYFDLKIPELRIFEAIKANPDYSMADIIGRDDIEPSEVSSAVGLMKEKGEINITELPEKDRAVIEGLHRKRGKSRGIFRINERVNRSYILTDTGAGIHAAVMEKGRPVEEISQLTPQMLKEGSWEGKSFRKYNISLPPPRITPGRKHPYREFLDNVKYKLVAMGFEEMRGGLVENEFWNIDALYMPQFHPARDIHDVYYVKEPASSKEIEEPFKSRVSDAHYSGGDTGSRGWKYHFDIEKAKRLMLRSQGTAVSARTLAGNPKIPGKYFSIARCFRYEQVDATHAQDFFQIEGIVLGDDINFRTLLGLLELFALEIAKAKEIEFLPAYFPFTEPSVELHVKHPKLGWMELGGAGIFRPEVTIPLGVNVPVIAWGLGLDRMAMVALEIHDIRDLFSGDLDMIRTKRVQWT